LYWSYPHDRETDSARTLVRRSISSDTNVSFEPSFARTCNSLRYFAVNPRLL
jgi:hypothetical protein